jgi:hypothetical protein
MSSTKDEAGTVRFQIQNFDHVLRFERRMHRIGNINMPIPGGVPTKAILVFVGTIIGVEVLNIITLGTLIGLLPFWFWWVLLPVGAAIASVSPAGNDKRRMPAFALAVIRSSLRPRFRTNFKQLSTKSDTTIHKTNPSIYFKAAQTRIPLNRNAYLNGPFTLNTSEPVKIINTKRRLELVASSDGATRIETKAGTRVWITETPQHDPQL